MSSQWISCDERLPDPGHAVLAVYCKEGRRAVIRAERIGKRTHEAPDDWDADDCDDDDEVGMAWLWPGWVELVESHWDYSYFAITGEFAITHWMEIPRLPEVSKEASK